MMNRIVPSFRSFCQTALALAFALSVAAPAVAQPASGPGTLPPFLQNGREVAIVKPYPWSGWWWPRSKQQMKGPLKKYDALVQKRTGRNPGAAAWEGKYHKHGEDWSGHCNGWSAAAILEPEPRAARIVDGIEFSLGDQKGLLTEMYMDCYYQFYGTRANRDSPVDPDILPHHFHRLLLEYLKVRQEPIVADIEPKSPVWNFPIYAFESAWTVDARKKVVTFETKVYYANDDVPIEYVGTAGFVKVYKYAFTLNDNGEVVGSKWLPGSTTKHPDFVWIPTADAPPGGWENHCLDAAVVRQICGLPAPEMPPMPEPPPASGAALISAIVETAPRTRAPRPDPDRILREAGLDPATLFP